MLERIIGLGTWGVTNLTAACRGLTALVECELPPTTGTHFSLFQNCYDLQVVSNINFNNASGANSLRSLFQNCVKLQYVPDIDAPNATNIQETFRGTFNLLGIGTFKVPSATGSTNWVYQSRIRILYGEYNFSGLTAANQMFQDTSRLTSAPPLSFPSLTTATQLFTNSSIQGLDVDLPVATAGGGILSRS